MAEAKEYTKDKEIIGFIKKFIKINPKDAKELRKNIEELGLIKVNSEQISKIIDLMPEDEESLNKIFVDINLDEDETKKILETIKKFK